MSDRETVSGWGDYVMSAVGLLLVLGLLLLIVLPSFLPARKVCSRNACINNLRQIDAAKEQAALELSWTNGTPVVTGDPSVNAYITGLVGTTNTPSCPNGGRYTYNPIGMNPKCSIGQPNDTLPPQP